MDTKNLLVSGKIPPRTECPFAKSCALRCSCHHTGILHQVPFSCAAARGYVMLTKKAP